MSLTKQPIDALVFDSGVGGLSVLSEILRLNPRLSFVYVADNAGLPYGDKSADWLQHRVSAVIASSLKIYTPKILVIACNTASTLVLPQLRSEVTFPVVGVVPAIKTAATFSKNRVIGLLATPATVARAYTDGLIQDFAKDCHVIRVGSSRLVELVEAKLRGQAIPLDELQRICQPFLEATPRPDAIVLGCTHFPLVPLELETVLPGIKLVDSGAAIAQRVQTLLEKTPPASQPTRDILFTALDAGINQLEPYLQSLGFLPAQHLILAKESASPK
ncbi:MAG TPA: glutamate racemase [Oligoflexus sp.]|uniref:glutamate racemase n=1 Tax=Oligoflexus sp. TaxID=1971216 RepID=UPI002D5E2BEB|nr:glutamate racemase [Oligoflexus sp.]HYX33013.1 glutamate racemase [Oligoflexus sp.]